MENVRRMWAKRENCIIFWELRLILERDPQVTLKVWNSVEMILLIGKNHTFEWRIHHHWDSIFMLLRIFFYSGIVVV